MPSIRHVATLDHNEIRKWFFYANKCRSSFSRVLLNWGNEIIWPFQKTCLIQSKYCMVYFDTASSIHVWHEVLSLEVLWAAIPTCMLGFRHVIPNQYWLKIFSLLNSEYIPHFDKTNLNYLTFLIILYHFNTCFPYPMKSEPHVFGK